MRTLVFLTISQIYICTTLFVAIVALISIRICQIVKIALRAFNSRTKFIVV